MKVEKLFLENFRNYESLEMPFNAGLNMLYGNNGQGKTNIAEAVYLICAARSHRTPREREMIRENADMARIKLLFSNAQRNMEAEIRLFRDRKHEIILNGVSNIKNMELIGQFQAVMFSPEDFSLIKDGPAERRKFMDIAISQLRPNYFKLLSSYNRYLKAKQKALKDKAFIDMISVYNNELAMLNAEIILYRMEFMEQLSPKIDALNREITGASDPLLTEYSCFITKSKDKEVLCKNALLRLERGKDREIYEKMCLYGIHREDLYFTLNGKPLKEFGSQGQIRTAILAVKLAQAELIKEKNGEYPILILDDILSELDASRRKYLLNDIRGKQVLLTGTDKASFARRKDTLLYKVENGKIY